MNFSPVSPWVRTGQHRAGHSSPDGSNQYWVQGRITSFDLLTIFLLMQPRRLLYLACTVLLRFTVVSRQYTVFSDLLQKIIAQKGLLICPTWNLKAYLRLEKVIKNYRLLLFDDYLAHLDLNLFMFVYLAKYNGQMDFGNKTCRTLCSLAVYSPLLHIKAHLKKAT